jgi:ArsR family transcriptional regulator
VNDLLEIFKALSDETRLKIISLLLEHSFCVGALAKQLGISEAAVSQHLQVLRKAGIVSGEKRGYYTHYCVLGEALKETGERMIKMSQQEKATGERCPVSGNGKRICKK